MIRLRPTDFGGLVRKSSDRATTLETSDRQNEAADQHPQYRHPAGRDGSEGVKYYAETNGRLSFFSVRYLISQAPRHAPKMTIILIGCIQLLPVLRLYW